MSKLERRLTRQLASKGEKNAHQLAINLLKKQGNMDQSGNLTEKGKKRQAMGNGGRAKDRASKASGGKHKPGDYKYDAKTNQAKLK